MIKNLIFMGLVLSGGHLSSLKKKKKRDRFINYSTLRDYINQLLMIIINHLITSGNISPLHAQISCH